MTDPDGTPGASRPGGEDLSGGTTPGVPQRAGEPTVPLVAPAPPDAAGPTVNLAGRSRDADSSTVNLAGRSRDVDGPTVNLAGRLPDVDGPTVNLAGRSPDADEPTANLAGRGLTAPAEPRPAEPRPAEPRPAGARPAEGGLTAPGDPEAEGGTVSRTAHAGLPVAGTDRVAVRGPAGDVDGGSAPAVPPGDLDLDGPAAEPRKSESPDMSPDPSISAALAEGDLDRPRIRRPAPAGTLIWVLLALLGFTLVVQLRSNDADDGLAATRQEDLVRILSDLESEDSRLLAQIAALQQSKQELNSEVGGREAALAEAERRSQDLGLLAGTVEGRGPGLDITLSDVRASDVLNTVQELRGAGGEVMQLNGANGTAVRLVASSFFVDASGGGIIADGEELVGPFHLLVIGPASTMSTALQIPGGVVASAKSDGGSVTMDSRSLVEVTAVRKAAALRYARPVS